MATIGFLLSPFSCEPCFSLLDFWPATGAGMTVYTSRTLVLPC